jgi:hypothetical protein
MVGMNIKVEHQARNIMEQTSHQTNIITHHIKQGTSRHLVGMEGASRN